MAKALKCDRCRAYFDNPNLDGNTMVITTWGKIVTLGLIANRDEYAEDNVFHLCDGCQKQLEDFLLMKEDTTDDQN